MKKTKENSEHYFWGEKCSGWHLVKSDGLSVIQEIMPAKTEEVRHYHSVSQQFFFILKGKAIFAIENGIILVSQGEGIHIKPNINHQIKNKTDKDLEFLVISQPSTQEDRVTL